MMQRFVTGLEKLKSPSLHGGSKITKYHVILTTKKSSKYHYKNDSCNFASIPGIT